MNSMEEKSFAKKIIQILDDEAISPSIENKLKLARQYAVLNKKKENFEVAKIPTEKDKKWFNFEFIFKSFKSNQNNDLTSHSKFFKLSVIKPTIILVGLISITTLSTLSIIHVDNNQNILGRNEEFIQKDINEVQSYQDEIDNDYNEMVQDNN